MLYVYVSIVVVLSTWLGLANNFLPCHNQVLSLYFGTFWKVTQGKIIAQGRIKHMQKVGGYIHLLSLHLQLAFERTTLFIPIFTRLSTLLAWWVQTTCTTIHPLYDLLQTNFASLNMELNLSSLHLISSSKCWDWNNGFGVHCPANRPCVGRRTGNQAWRVLVYGESNKIRIPVLRIELEILDFIYDSLSHSLYHESQNYPEFD